MGRKNVKIKDIFFNHYKFLGTQENSLKFYNPPPRNLILFPFKLKFDSVERLLVLNFEKDPIYFRIELQIIRKTDKDYPLVILYRKDNMVDIYYTNETVIKNRKKMLTELFLNASFNQLEVIEFKFQFDDMGLDAYLFLEDKLEKEIEFKIKENKPKRKLTSILIPLEIANKQPEHFPIVFLDKFGMIPKKNTEMLIKIHGTLREIAGMPFQINKADIYAAHYSLNPVTAKWNSNFSDIIDPIILSVSSPTLSEKNINFELKNNSGYYEIKKISGNDEKDHIVSFEFSPPIPNLLSLRNNSKIKGRFSCVIDDKKGIFGGDYYLNRTGEIIECIFAPTKGWQFSSGMLWLKTYKWTATIHIQDNATYKIKSYWRKTTG